MNSHDLTRALNIDNGHKIVLLVADGLGGLPLEPGGKTELESAATPHLDVLVQANVCGLLDPVAPGITPGSGPGHLALFGYDPLEHTIGRGALEALGIDFDLGVNDVAARGNFCTIDDRGLITDRRAGRIPTETCVALVERLRTIAADDVELFVEPVREHRFVLVFRGDGLGADIADTDPQATGVRPLDPAARNPYSRRTADLAARFIRQAGELLQDAHPANMVTLRGFASRPPIPSMREVYGLTAAAIAVYPMYRGLARLVGMDIRDAGTTLEQQVDALARDWDASDFFFLHFKYTDSTGEDGRFDEKVQRIEELDALMPRITALDPDVLIVTGDHSTPSLLREHSWHPVPTLLAARTCRPDQARHFGESEALHGGLGRFEAKRLMPLALAHAGRLQKFGA